MENSCGGGLANNFTLEGEWISAVEGSDEWDLPDETMNHSN
jgi:hypothetical protein